MNGVFHYPAFFEVGNNDPENAFVLKLMGSREMIPILGTSLYIYDKIQWTFEASDMHHLRLENVHCQFYNYKLQGVCQMLIQL